MADALGPARGRRSTCRRPLGQRSDGPGPRVIPRPAPGGNRPPRRGGARLPDGVDPQPSRVGQAPAQRAQRGHSPFGGGDPPDEGRPAGRPPRGQRRSRLHRSRLCLRQGSRRSSPCSRRRTRPRRSGIGAPGGAGARFAPADGSGDRGLRRARNGRRGRSALRHRARRRRRRRDPRDRGASERGRPDRGSDRFPRARRRRGRCPLATRPGAGAPPGGVPTGARATVTARPPIRGSGRATGFPTTSRRRRSRGTAHPSPPGASSSSTGAGLQAPPRSGGGGRPTLRSAGCQGPPVSVSLALESRECQWSHRRLRK